MVYAGKKELIAREIRPTDVVVDVGFWGQGVSTNNPNWPHRLLYERGCTLYGVDVSYDSTGLLAPAGHYYKGSAEDFTFPVTFDVIFAGDLIEHLSNPGLFLARAAQHSAPDGRLIITTPNCFNLFNLTEKISKYEPTVNGDHTCYFNTKTLRQLLEKNGWETVHTDYVYALDVMHSESWKKKLLNALYRLLSFFTDKFMETLVITARKRL